MQIKSMENVIFRPTLAKELSLQFTCMRTSVFIYSDVWRTVQHILQLANEGLKKQFTHHRRHRETNQYRPGTHRYVRTRSSFDCLVLVRSEEQSQRERYFLVHDVDRYCCLCGVMSKLFWFFSHKTDVEIRSFQAFFFFFLTCFQWH